MDQLPVADEPDPLELKDFPAQTELDSTLARAIRRLIAASQIAESQITESRMMESGRAEDAIAGLPPPVGRNTGARPEIA
jgi:hypothetical protein